LRVASWNANSIRVRRERLRRWLRADPCTEASSHRDERKGKLASDHVPVLATFAEN
jgi:exonuclease III